MMELMATGRKARSRYFSVEEMQHGIGILITEATDFPRAERDRLTSAIVAAYKAGKLTGETLDLARRVGTALRTTLPTLEALRVHLGTDGREMIAQVRKVATVIPPLASLAAWIA